MATVEHPSLSAETKAQREEILNALDRGDILRLLAAVDAGRLDRQEFERALEQHSRKRWFQQVIWILLNR